MTKAAEHSCVAVLGASTKEDRYSFKAVQMLREHGHTPIPVHPAGHTVDGIPALRSLEEIAEPVDTLSIYVNPDISSGQYEQILKLQPRRVIFNPDTENEDLAGKLEKAGMEVVRACTLVMLRTDQF